MTTEISKVMYRRCRHAAHTGPKQGWDLEEWHVFQEWNDGRPDDVPLGAERHHGYRQDGRQVVVWVRRAAFSEGTCQHCPKGVN